MTPRDMVGFTIERRGSRYEFEGGPRRQPTDQEVALFQCLESVSALLESTRAELAYVAEERNQLAERAWAEDAEGGH